MVLMAVTAGTRREIRWIIQDTGRGAWPGSELVVLDDAGPGGTGFAEARTAALERFRTLR